MVIVMAAEKLPYDAKHVVYRDEGAMIHAFWAADPDVARQLADRNTSNEDINRLWRRDDVENIATATRYYKRDGADFTGWIVSSPTDYSAYSDPIPNKRAALLTLHAYVAEAFKR